MTTTNLSRPRAVTGLRGTGELARIIIDWKPAPWETVVDHYAVYAVRGTGSAPITPSNLVAKTIYPRFVHQGLGPYASEWTYRVVTVNAGGTSSQPSNPVWVASQASVTVSGTPVAVVGDFDGKGLEFALSPNGYSQYNATFPDGVDFRYGTDSAGTGWSYLQPGPSDGWAGRRNHLFRLRFDLAEPPAQDLDLALWLIDSHASIAGSVVLTINGTTVDRIAFEGGATKGSLQGDSTVPGSALKPSFIERPLARSLFKAGENIVELFKDEGSWIAYDAVGLFARA